MFASSFMTLHRAGKEVKYLKLSTKGRYGLRAVLDIAAHGQEEAVALSSTSEREGISISYLEQLVSKLKKAGILNSIRGAQGGYVLARPATEISVGDVLRSLEGSLSPVECGELDGEEGCSAAKSCVTKYVWKKISDSINETVDAITIAELVKESHCQNQEQREKNVRCSG